MDSGAKKNMVEYYTNFMGTYKDYFCYYNVCVKDFMWFCGLFEAEGSISFAPPSASKSQSVLKLSLKDKDILEKVSHITKTAVSSYSEHNYKMYRVTVVGLRAIEISKLMLPFMSERRQDKIKKIIAAFQYKTNLPLKIEHVQKIETMLRQKYKIREISLLFGIGNSVVSSIKNNKHYTQIKQKDYIIEIPKVIGDPQKEELSWLSGLLEGDGSFLHGTPSCPSNCKISLFMKDEDVVSKVSKIWNKKYQFVKDRKQFQVALVGGKAMFCMKAIYNNMGTRRKQRIDEIIEKQKQIRKYKFSI